MSLFTELKRRNVFRVAAGYAVVAWLLIQASDILLGNFGAPGWVFQSLVVFLVIGFIIALILAWAYELTPEGIHRTAPGSEGEPAPAKGRRLDGLIVVGLVLVIGVLLVERFWFAGNGSAPTLAEAPAGTSPTMDAVTAPALESGMTSATADAPGPRSVAVLPFVSMSTDPDNESFSDGLTEELLNALAQVEGLQVAARTSSFRFKGETGDMADIARQLRVSHLLEGSVRRSGERVRITAQLINAADGFHLWSQTYDRQLADIFAIQDDIAAEVTRALRVRLLGEATPSVPRPPTGNLEAYTHYLRGRQASQSSSYDALERAEAAFNQALALDPDFAAALAGLAQTLHRQTYAGMVAWPQARTSIEDLVQQALALDPDQPLALAISGRLMLVDEGEDRGFGECVTRAERNLRRALELEPAQAEASAWLAEVLQWRGQTEEALAVQLAALARDPLSAQRHVEVAQLYAFLNRFDQAESHINTAAELAPDEPMPVMWLSWIRYSQGRIGEAIAVRSRLLLLNPRDPEGLIRIVQYYLELDLSGAARPWLEAAEQMAPESTTTRLFRALWHWRSGDRATAAVLASAALDEDLPARWGSRWLFEDMERVHAIDTGAHESAIARRLAHDPQALDPPDPDETIDSEAFQTRVHSLDLLELSAGQTAARERAEQLLDQLDRQAGRLPVADPGLWARVTLLGFLDRPEEMIAILRELDRGHHELDAWFLTSTFAPLVGHHAAPVVQVYLAEHEAIRERERAWLAVPGRMPDPAALLPQMAQAAARAPRQASFPQTEFEPR